MEDQQKVEIQGDFSITPRFIAFLIDYGLTFLLTFIYVCKFGVKNEDGGHTVTGWPAIVPILFWIIYFPLTETLLGATLGHLIVGLKVIKTSGGKLELIDCIKRHLIDPFELFPFGITAIITIKKTANHQRVGDLWADTIVVRK